VAASQWSSDEPLALDRITSARRHCWREGIGALQFRDIGGFLSKPAAGSRPRVVMGQLRPNGICQGSGTPNSLFPERRCVGNRFRQPAVSETGDSSTVAIPSPNWPIYGRPIHNMSIFDRGCTGRRPARNI